MKAQTTYPSLEKLTAWHHVSSIRFLGPLRFKRLWEELGDDLEKIFTMTKPKLEALKGITTPQVLQGIEDQRDRKAKSKEFATEQLERAQSTKGSIVLLDHPLYPSYLMKSKMCHPIIYAKGHLEKFLSYDRSIGVVGTRNPKPSSAKTARESAKKLAKLGWTVISGMAKGIDSEAHWGALEAEGKTVAVLGCGPDVVYPSEARNLYEKLLETNLIISEYPFGAKAEPLNLRKRNKTTVALSSFLFVVQSKKDGGAMNAVTGAEEQRKPVMTVHVPGSDFDGNAFILKCGGIAYDQREFVSQADRLLQVGREALNLTSGAPLPEGFVKLPKKKPSKIERSPGGKP